MKLIIKHKNVKIDKTIDKYLNDKFKKFEKFAIEPLTVEIVLEDKFGLKEGLDKLVHVFYSWPGQKKPVHISAATNNFHGSIDIIQKKFERKLLRYKEQKKIGTRFPKKYFLSNLKKED